MRCNIKFNQLILVGYRKNYIVNFIDGVNIIYGDSDTGKTSILEIINYSLGASKIDLYPEIESSVKYPILELNLNNITYCIKRDLFDTKKLIEIYKGEYKEINSIFPELVYPNISQESDENKSLSSFLFETLNIPKVKVKESPSKATSRMSRLSFRDILKYCYLDQENVGSKFILDHQKNYAVATKNKETFKYIYNILDTRISDLDAEISEKSTNLKKLENNEKAIRKFLREVKFDTSEKLREKVDEIDSDLEDLNHYLADLNIKMRGNSEFNEDLRSQINFLNIKISEANQYCQESQLNIQKYIRLKNDYLLDIQKLESTLKLKPHLRQKSEESEEPICPTCDQTLPVQSALENFQLKTKKEIESEIRKLKRRVKVVSELTESKRTSLLEKEEELYRTNQDLERAKRLLDDKSTSFISPFLQERDSIISEIALLQERKSQLIETSKIRNQLFELVNDIDRIRKDILTLKDKLKSLKETAPSQSSILSELGDLFNCYLNSINIKNITGVSINENSFLPIVRGMDYSSISSGGLRTICSIGYYASILESGILFHLNLPNILMIDTVGKYLGKTKQQYLPLTDKKADQEEGISDPLKYRNIYSYLMNIVERYKKNNISCQILLIDNDLPESIENEFSSNIIAHFSSAGLKGLPIGLIDDANSNASSLNSDEI